MKHVVTFNYDWLQAGLRDSLWVMLVVVAIALLIKLAIQSGLGWMVDANPLLRPKPLLGLYVLFAVPTGIINAFVWEHTHSKALTGLADSATCLGIWLLWWSLPKLFRRNRSRHL